MGEAGRCRWIGKTAVAKLRRHAEELRAEGIAALYLFGSTARGEAAARSDVDLFFDHGDPKLSLIELVRVKERLSTILGGRADIMTRDSLHPMLRERIAASAIRIF